MSLYPVYVITGIRYLRFALNEVCAKKIQKGGTLKNFATFKNSPKTFISGIRYIRNLVHPVCAISDMGCVIVEGDSLALVTALKIVQGTLYQLYLTAYKMVTSLVLKKPVL